MQIQIKQIIYKIKNSIFTTNKKSTPQEQNIKTQNKIDNTDNTDNINNQDIDIKNSQHYNDLKNQLKQPVSQLFTNQLNYWYHDSYQSTVVQRNFLMFTTIICIITVAFAAMAIRYIRNSKSIEPFVIEIEKKTGVPTVVDPISVEEYSANEVIKRYFIMQYIKAREEYNASSYFRNYNIVVRVLSSKEVYYNDYRPKFSKTNPNSPYNTYGQTGTRNISWKSIIFPSDKTAQVRISMESNIGTVSKSDKIVLLEFDFQNIEMNEEERLINPLGFIVTLYRIEDENVTK